MFYNQLDALCKEKKTSEYDVLHAMNLSRGNIRRWKDGVNPKYETKLKIANYLKISVEQLMSGTELTEYQKNILPKDPDIRRIERARKSMPQEEKDRMMDIMKDAFAIYFNDDYEDDDRDE